VTRFSDEVAAAIALAREHAEEQAAVGPEHLLGALPLAAPGVVEAALGVPGGDWVRERLAATLPVEALPRIGERPLTASAAAALELAVDEAARAGCEAVGPRHLLAGLLRATPQVVAWAALVPERLLAEIRAQDGAARVVHLGERPRGGAVP
jgi:hypothetical protein